MHIHFQSRPHHAHWVANAVLCIQQEFLRKHFQKLAILRQSDALGGLDDPRACPPVPLRGSQWETFPE